MEPRGERPVARTAGLVVKTVGDEVLVYDLERHRAHSLNRVAAAVWRACDGSSAEGEITARLRDAEAIPVTRELVRYGLRELERARLVSESGREWELTRRDLMRRLGTVAVAVPVVTSIVAPTVAQAQSCTGAGLPCTSVAQCCPGLFCPGGDPSVTRCCGGQGQACTANVECCSFQSVVCISGVCQPEP
jgi:Coenzyme PQQ synthesis protein D (PqqD)